jgi:hypothetical protein
MAAPRECRLSDFHVLNDEEIDMKTLRDIAIAAAFVGTAGVAYCQKMTTDELKSKGATVVAKDDLSALLKGANVRYEKDWSARQITLNADGSLVGSQWKMPRRGSKLKMVHGTWTTVAGATPRTKRAKKKIAVGPCGSSATSTTSQGRPSPAWRVNFTSGSSTCIALQVQAFTF